MIADEVLRSLGLPHEQHATGSEARFPDGAAFRIEIPSVESPEVLRAVVDEASSRGVVVNRVSQGSGAMTLTSSEIREMSRIGFSEQLEVCLFVGPREEWGVGASVRVGDGSGLRGQVRGLRQLRLAIEDVARACELGIRSFLVADLGLLEALTAAREVGALPSDVIWKSSVVIAPSNPLSLAMIERLGAATINLPTDVTMFELAEMRWVSKLPLDLYLEAPDALGGTVRFEQLSEFVKVGAPLYAKFGLRNSTPLYPSGLHLAQEASVIGREKVRRAQIALELMVRDGIPAMQSSQGAAGLAVPAP